MRGIDRNRMCPGSGVLHWDARRLNRERTHIACPVCGRVLAVKVYRKWGDGHPGIPPHHRPEDEYDDYE